MLQEHGTENADNLPDSIQIGVIHQQWSIVGIGAMAAYLAPTAEFPSTGKFVSFSYRCLMFTKRKESLEVYYKLWGVFSFPSSTGELV